MASQGQLATQRASASIGQQETANQRVAAQQAAQIQQLERAGEATAEGLRIGGAEKSRGLQYEKTQGLMGLASGQLSAANEAVAAAEAQKASGISGIIGGVTSCISSGISAFGSDDFKESGFGKLLTGK